MYELDKEKFGAFLVQLRKEKGLTQKELAERLYVSDKAVSKWERALSLPDITLLQPMAEYLGVTVTELLSGRRIPEDQPLTVAEVEPLVTGHLTMTAQERAAQKEHRRQWGMWYLLALACMSAELFQMRGRLLADDSICYILTPLMAAGFGAYFVFGAREKLPAFYDQYRINFYSDGPFRMNVPGVRFNNRNWTHILNALRMWACLSMAAWIPLYCMVIWTASRLLEGHALFLIELGFCLAGLFGGMFIPVAVVGRKYE